MTILPPPWRQRRLFQVLLWIGILVPWGLAMALVGAWWAIR